MNDWTPELVKQLLAELRKQSEVTQKLVEVLRDLHDSTEALRAELRHLRTERDQRERFADLQASAGGTP